MLCRPKMDDRQLPQNEPMTRIDPREEVIHLAARMQYHDPEGGEVLIQTSAISYSSPCFRPYFVLAHVDPPDAHS